MSTPAISFMDVDAIDQELLRKGVHPDVIAKLAGGQPSTPAVSMAQPQPGSRDYNLRLGATSQPTPPVSFMGPKPEPTAPDLQPAPPAGSATSFVQPGQPAKPASIGDAGANPIQQGTPAVSFAQRFAEEQARGQAAVTGAQQSADAIHPSFWRRLGAAGVGALAGAAGGGKAGQEAGAAFLNRPRAEAEANVEQVRKGSAERLAGIKTEAGIADVESQTRERDALAEKALREPVEKPEDIVKQYSDALATGNTARAEELKPKVREFLDNTQKPTAEKADKKVDEYTNNKGARVTQWQRPDGSKYLEHGEQVREAGGAPGAQADDPKLIAQGIIDGNQPPDTKGLYRNTSAVRAELERHGYNLMRAEQDWQATQKYMATLNGSQQTRLRQAVGFTKDSLTQVEDIYNEWLRVGASSGWKSFNKASLATAKQLPGAPGELAHRLEARVADLTSELGTVYKGGNSSTDESLKLAAQNLGSDWNEQTFKNAIKDIRESIRIRENSMKNLQPAGVSPGNAYTPPATQGGAARDFGAAPAGKQEGNTGTLPDGTKVIVRGGRIVANQ